MSFSCYSDDKLPQPWVQPHWESPALAPGPRPRPGRCNLKDEGPGLWGLGDGLRCCSCPAGEARNQLREAQVSSAPPRPESESSEAQGRSTRANRVGPSLEEAECAGRLQGRACGRTRRGLLTLSGEFVHLPCKQIFCQWPLGKTTQSAVHRGFTTHKLPEDLLSPQTRAPSGSELCSEVCRSIWHLALESTWALEVSSKAVFYSHLC